VRQLEREKDVKGDGLQLLSSTISSPMTVQFSINSNITSMDTGRSFKNLKNQMMAELIEMVQQSS
jgi:hypothetical protein